MGGSGNGGGYLSSAEDIQPAREEAFRNVCQQERDVDVNEVLCEALRRLNDRDVELTRDWPEAIQGELSSMAVDVDRSLFGGSVAKHTYVDGLSDVDALGVIDATDVTHDGLVQRLRTSLSQGLNKGDVADISAGILAMTVRPTGDITGLSAHFHQHLASPTAELAR